MGTAVELQSWGFSQHWGNIQYFLLTPVQCPGVASRRLWELLSPARCCLLLGMWPHAQQARRTDCSAAWCLPQIWYLPNLVVTPKTRLALSQVISKKLAEALLNGSKTQAGFKLTDFFEWKEEPTWNFLSASFMVG